MLVLHILKPKLKWNFLNYKKCAKTIGSMTWCTKTFQLSSRAPLRYLLPFCPGQ